MAEEAQAMLAELERAARDGTDLDLPVTLESTRVDRAFHDDAPEQVQRYFANHKVNLAVRGVDISLNIEFEITGHRVGNGNRT